MSRWSMVRRRWRWSARIFGVCVLLMTLPAVVDAQGIDMDAAQAEEEFRWGVLAYHAGRFNDAIVAFTRTVSFRPDDFLAREWLGRGYYRSGLVDAALGEWEVIVENGRAEAYLQSRIDTLRYRRGVLPLLEEEIALSRSQRVFGQRGQTTLFRRPNGIATEPGGDAFLVSVGTQEVLRITPNGSVRNRIRGGLDGLDTPFDVVWRDGLLYVTEFGRDRISVFEDGGTRVSTIGAPGLEEGRLLGPQYIAIDADGFIYVTEWGARRVTKFSPNGEFALSFGRETPFFEGFERPTGIAIRDGEIFVADVSDDGPLLHLFDESGNHLARIELPLDHDDAPDGIVGTVVEDIGWYDDDHLMITAGERVLIFDPDLQAIVAEVTDQERSRVSSVARDANNRVLVSDFDSDDFAIYEPEGTLYAGLDVRIERIINRDFPTVGVLVAVHDRDGRPIVGLESQNFIISENGRPQTTARVESTGQVGTRLETVALVQPRSGQRYAEDAGRAVFDLVAAIPASNPFDVYVAGREAILASERPASPELFADRVAQVLVERDDLFISDEVALDRSIRVAASDLLRGDIRRNLVLVGDGRVGDSAFREYGIEELGAYLLNNGIRLHFILVEQRTPDPELSYLVETTNGTIRYVYEPEGVSPMVAEFQSFPSGRYWIEYNSTTNPDFGRSYIELSAEAQIFVRSGRDEMGFFAPAEP